MADSGSGSCVMRSGWLFRRGITLQLAEMGEGGRSHIGGRGRSRLYMTGDNDDQTEEHEERLVEGRVDWTRHCGLRDVGRRKRSGDSLLLSSRRTR